MRLLSLLFVCTMVVLAGCSSGKEKATQDASQQRMLRISVLASGDLLADGESTDLGAIRERLAKLAKNDGMVLYYREGAEGNPPESAMRVMELIVEYELPISL
ncbi:MAG: hypothetical protein JW889_03430 [Verrucomicrobia bacterium]|nr:hypothetical protein [Verrucomicrobiota bacterium]